MASLSAMIITFIFLLFQGNVLTAASAIREGQSTEDFEYEGVWSESDNSFECPSTETLSYPHPIYCEQYYKCVNGVPELLVCSKVNNFLFNDEEGIRQCFHAHQTHCGDRIRPDYAPSTYKPPSTTTTEKVTTTPSTLAPTTTTSPPVQFNCTANGVFPHPKHCELYIDCWEGRPAVSTCPNGTLFDTEHCWCNDARLTDCGDRIRPSPPGSFECPSEGDIYYPDPDNCAAFYRCVDGLISHYLCSPGLHFNPEVDVCDYPYNVECNERPLGNSYEVTSLRG